MSNRVIIDQTTNTVSTDQCPEIHNSVVVNNDVPTTIDVIENVTNIVTVTVPGAQGSQGPIGPSGPSGSQGPAGPGADVTGSQYYVPVFKSATGLVTSSIYQSGSFTSIRNATSPEDPTNPDILYVKGDGVDTYNLISADSNKNGYVQIHVQNFNNSTEASSDIVATADNGTESTNYIDMGINSSGFTNVGNVGGQNDAYVYSTGNDLYIGNASAGKQVIIFNGGLDAATQAKVWIHDQGTVGINTDTYNTTNPPSLQVNAPNDTTYNIAQFFGNTDNFAQVGIANANGGTTASADLVLYNNIDYDNQLAGFVDLGINSTNYVYNGVYPGSAGDAYLFTDSEHLVIGSTSGSGQAKITLFAGGISEVQNAKLTLYGNNRHQMTGSLSATQGFTGSLYGTASWAINTLTSSIATNAATASSADNFVVRNSLTASNAIINGTLTAQTLVVQTVTSSVIYSSGSNIFGNDLSNTQVFTGSVSITGSLSLNGNNVITSDQTSSMSVLSASFSTSASLAQTASFVLGTVASASFATTAISSSYPIAVTGSTLYSFDAGIPSGPSTDNSIFFGQESGHSASSADRSIFLGYRAGYSASAANYSNFFGSRAGAEATDAYYSNFLGEYAGYQASSAHRSNFIGNQAGLIATYAENSNFIGYKAGYVASNAYHSNFFGNSSGWYAIDAGHSNFIGERVGYYATSASFSTLIGYKVGANFGYNVTPGIGRNNIIIGTSITLPDNSQDSINIGGLIFASGSYFNDSYYGNPFSGSANGRVGINQPLPTFNLDVSGSGRYTNGLQVTSSLLAPDITGSLFGTASWAQNSITASYVSSSNVVGTVTSASYALTASYALNAGGASAITIADEGTSQGTATFINFTGAGVTATVSSNTASINITGGAGSAFPFSGSALITGSLGVTGSVSITGSLNVGNTNIEFQENTNVTSGSWRVVSSEPTASYRAAFFDYVMFSGSIARAGTVYSVWSASYAEYYENYTGDVGGSTSGVTLQAAISGSNIQLQATASNSTWTIRSLVRML